MSGRAKLDERGPFQPGDQFQKFEIKALLGRGGHAFVYHGYDGFLDRHVALKVIPAPAERGRDLQRRAQLEARVLCKLQHPNVVRVIDAGPGQDLVYLVMELLAGRTLRDVFRELRTLTLSEALTIGAQIADGAQAAHAENAIHRDLKPENVFIQADNAVKVLDFGIAKLLGESGHTTQKDLLHGTIMYMSPEHLQGLGVTARSDIYALGTILYEAISGTAPCLLALGTPTVRELAWAQISHVPPTLDKFVPGVPRHVARLVQRMLAKDPADRYASMQEVADAMRNGLARLAREAGGATLPLRQLWHTAPVQEADTELVTRPPFTVATRAPLSLGSPTPSGEEPAPPATRTVVLDPELVADLGPTRTAALPVEQTPPAVDSDRTDTKRKRASVAWIVGAAIAAGTLAGTLLGVAGVGVQSRPGAAARGSMTPRVSVAASAPPLALPTAAPRTETMAEPQSEIVATAPVPAAPAAPALEPAVSDARAPRVAKLSPPVSATAGTAPRAAASDKAKASKAGAFSLLLRSARAPAPAAPKVNDLPGSGLD